MWEREWVQATDVPPYCSNCKDFQRKIVLASGSTSSIKDWFMPCGLVEPIFTCSSLATLHFCTFSA